VPQLLQKLANGNSLAGVAKAQGKSVDKLKKAILDSAKQDFDQAVKDGVMTEAQAKEELGELQSRLDAIVTGAFPGPMERRGFHWRQGPGEDTWRAPAA
jgi:hypothetical protein